MVIKQLSVSLDNVPGSFSTVSEILGREGVNIRAISVADTSDISTVRFVVDDPEKAKNILTGNGYHPKETDVLAVEIPDHPGGMNAVLKPLKAAGINVHYLYPHLGRIEQQRHRHPGRGQDRRGPEGAGGELGQDAGARSLQRVGARIARRPGVDGAGRRGRTWGGIDERRGRPHTGSRCRRTSQAHGRGCAVPSAADRGLPTSPGVCLSARCVGDYSWERVDPREPRRRDSWAHSSSDPRSPHSGHTDARARPRRWRCRLPRLAAAVASSPRCRRSWA